VNQHKRDPFNSDAIGISGQASGSHGGIQLRESYFLRAAPFGYPQDKPHPVERSFAGLGQDDAKRKGANSGSLVVLQKGRRTLSG
jgi:hypothetical protein